ncbi:methylsterol monooxygenase 1-1-like isoform X1 [Papaver somniferum]|uniref:methylsterol monooxygenase 1-1-like isoform X1 n=1 Tax=Papaver somniferum TaxID=3469 RepID=UPI000E70048E|nr:methylsterol monooxygenase 1-1-like isoform X1 [Papaver somniferum]
MLERCYDHNLSCCGSSSACFSVQMVGIRTGLPLPSGWEMVMQLLVYFLVEDYTNYWLHRWLHCKWGYDKIHSVHHEYEAPIGFAAPYAHWAEILILGIPTFLGPAMVPGHMITFWSWIILRQMEAIETHSGYDFPWTPTKYIPFYGGSEYHDYHHYVGGQSQSNFASVFTYCDYIYGTDKGYRYQKHYLEKLKEAGSSNISPSRFIKSLKMHLHLLGNLDAAEFGLKNCGDCLKSQLYQHASEPFTL